MAQSTIGSSNCFISQRPFGSFQSLITRNLSIIESGVDFYSTVIRDIEVISNSLEIIEQLDTIDFLFRTRHRHLSICYLTGQLLAPQSFPERPILNMDLGTMAISRGLDSFVTYGPKNVSSLVGTILGIRAFEVIRNQWLGIHSSALYDTLTKKIHLIYGQTTAGKSSAAYLVEKASNKRFIVINDDWNEVSLKEHVVIPAANFLGEPRDEYVKNLLSNDASFAPHNPSFGKAWYSRKSSSLPQSGALGCIFQLDIRSRIQDDVYIHRKNNAHIPFMSSNLEKPFVSEELLEESRVFEAIVRERVSKLVEGYVGLANSMNYYVIDAGSANSSTISARILDILRSNS